VASMFARKFPAAERKAAGKFACFEKRVTLFQAFDAGKTKAEVIMELRVEYLMHCVSDGSELP
jgi:hypothetical protein